MAAPGGGQSRTDIVAPGQAIAYPAGWLHLQLNDNCQPIESVVVFNNINSGGTFNLPQSLSSFDAAYTSVAWVTPLPSPQPTNWVIDSTCAARCGINATSAATQTAKAQFQNKLQETAGLVFSGEQVAAADATALFAQGAEKVLSQDAQLAAAAVKSKFAAAKNATRAAVGK